jgi:hypothetical protein
LTVHDPPVSFAQGGPRLPISASVDRRDRSVTLVGKTAFVATRHAVQVVSLRSGAVRRTIAPPAPSGTPPSRSSSSGPLDRGPAPVVTSLFGHKVVLSAYLQASPGQGTTPGTLSIVVEVITPARPYDARSVRVPIPGQPESAGPLTPASLHVIGASDGIVVVARTRGSQNPVTRALDLGSGKPLWTSSKIVPKTVYRHTLLASREDAKGETHLVGLDVAKGKSRWTSKRGLISDPSVFGAAGKHVLVSGTLYTGNAYNYLSLLDVTTGQHRDVKKPSEDARSYRCVYDQQRTSVCSGDLHHQVLGVDARSGKVLWQIGGPGHQDRLVPHISTTFHGAVYGSTRNGSVVLDARTGKDRNTHPGLTPVLVNRYVGVAPDQQGQLRAYRATR